MPRAVPRAMPWQNCRPVRVGLPGTGSLDVVSGPFAFAFAFASVRDAQEGKTVRVCDDVIVDDAAARDMEDERSAQIAI